MSLEASVKLEPEWESESVVATAPLFYAVKEEVQELDLGPELLEPPDVDYALKDIVKKEPTAHEQAAPGLTCSVVLEPMLVDLKSDTCTIGLQTYDFQLHHENQESLEISFEEYEINIKEEVKTEEGENENTSRQNADIREISPVNLASSTKMDRLGAEQKTVYEFVTRSINNCKFCSGTFDTKLLLQEHEKSQHGVKYFTCSTLTENGNLKVKLNTENKLDECKTTFATSSNLGDHLGTHTGEKTFNCNICDSAFAKSRYLRAHLKTHTGEKRFKCNQCSSAFNYRSLLQIHLRTHSGEKPFKCNMCDSAFARSGTLGIHLRTHSGKKPFKCIQCSSAFISHSKLQVHLITHTGEKPFKCCLCSSFFSRRSNLRAHLRTHTGEKPFKCNQCSFSFTDSSKLRTHLRIHTGEKPFKCNICDYKASRSGSLKSHIISRHSGQKPYGCDACSYKGATKDHLSRHVNKKH